MINITNPRARILWQQEMERGMKVLESGFARKLTPLLNRQFRDAAKFVSQGMLDSTDFAINRREKDHVELLSNHYRRVATVFGKKAFGIIEKNKFANPGELKSPIDEYWGSINSWAATEAAQKIRRIQKSTKSKIGSIIKTGMREGESHREIAKRITDTSYAINPFRAQTIALTETHTAAVKSVDTAVKSTRIEMEREWVSAKDDRTRTRAQGSPFEHFLKFPAGPDGEKVAQDGKFVGTGEALEYPGDSKGSPGNVIRCRCVVLYHPVRSTEPMKPYEPEEPAIIHGRRANSAEEIMKRFDDAQSATFEAGKSPADLKRELSRRLGNKLWVERSKHSDELANLFTKTHLPEASIRVNHYEMMASKIVAQWAGSSGDRNRLSVMIQLAAQKEFNLKGASIWWEKIVVEEARDLLKKHEVALRRFLRIMYEDTQAELKRRGLKTVSMARGYTSEKPPGKLSTPDKPFYKTNVEMQPLSSFSSDVAEARGFAMGDNFGTIVFGEIPVERILSTPLTGFGCMGEAEYVVLSAAKRGIAEKVFASSINTREIDFWKLFNISSEERSRKKFREVIAKKLFEELK